MLFSGYRMREYKRLHPLQDGTTDGHMSHAAEQGPRCSFQYRIRKYKRLRPLQSGADRREHVSCRRTRPPMLVPIPDTQIQEITPFTKRSRQTGTCHMRQNKAPDALFPPIPNCANTRDYALYKTARRTGTCRIQPSQTYCLIHQEYYRRYESRVFEKSASISVAAP